MNTNALTHYYKQLYYPTKLALNQFHAHKGQKGEGEGKNDRSGATTNILIHE